MILIEEKSVKEACQTGAILTILVLTCRATDITSRGLALQSFVSKVF